MSDATTEATRTIAEWVARGATLLDEKRPGWAGQVSKDRLAMVSCTKCVLGQIYGDFGLGLSALDLWGRSVGFGFSALDPSDYISLADLWRAEIARRLAAGEDRA